MKRPTPAPGPFSLAVRDQLGMEMRRRGQTALSLSKLIPRGKSYLSERFNGDEKAFTLTDLELICGALGLDITQVVGRAQFAAKERTEKLLSAVPEHINGITPDGYALAAKHHEDNDVNEEDYF